MLAEIDDYDWAEVFGEAYSCSKEIDSLDGTSCDDFTREDVVEIIAIQDGQNDGDEWLGVFKLKDGRFLAATGWCDYTGWDCQSGTLLTVGATLSEVVMMGLTESQRKQLNFANALN